MNPHTITRLTAPEDLDRAVSIWLEASKAAHDFIDAEYWEMNAKAMKEIYLPQSETWIYKDANGAVAGFLSLVEDHLASLFVHPGVQAKGIGSALMRKAKELRRRLTLNVYLKNENAVRFYRKHEFQIAETRKDAHTGAEEYVMTWEA